MPLRYKINVIDELKKKGYTQYKLRAEKIMGQSTIQRIRKKEALSWENIEVICRLLHCQPNYFLEYVED